MHAIHIHEWLHVWMSVSVVLCVCHGMDARMCVFIWMNMCMEMDVYSHVPRDIHRPTRYRPRLARGVGYCRARTLRNSRESP